MESMDDYKEELEASLKKIRVGDVVTGTVLDVTDDAVIVDLKTYADGVIRKEDLSEDPDFNMAEMIHPGDEITATVMATNDGEGNMVRISGRDPRLYPGFPPQRRVCGRFKGIRRKDDRSDRDHGR